MEHLLFPMPILYTGQEVLENVCLICVQYLVLGVCYMLWFILVFILHWYAGCEHSQPLLHCCTIKWQDLLHLQYWRPVTYFCCQAGVSSCQLPSFF